MSTKEHPVVDDTNTVATPTVDSASAQQDPLDELLASYDEATKTDGVITPPKPMGDGNSNSETDRRLNLMEQKLQRYEQGETRQVVDKIVNDIKGEIVIDNDLVEGWLIKQANKDRRLDQAFNERDTNPQKWSAVETELKKKFHKVASQMIDKEATDDRNAVAAAVKGASTKVPADPPPDFSTMSAAEFQAAKRRLFRK